MDQGFGRNLVIRIMKLNIRLKMRLFRDAYNIMAIVGLLLVACGLFVGMLGRGWVGAWCLVFFGALAGFFPVADYFFSVASSEWKEMQREYALEVAGRLSRGSGSSQGAASRRGMSFGRSGDDAPVMSKLEQELAEIDRAAAMQAAGGYHAEAAENLRREIERASARSAAADVADDTNDLPYREFRRGETFGDTTDPIYRKVHQAVQAEGPELFEGIREDHSAASGTKRRGGKRRGGERRGGERRRGSGEKAEPTAMDRAAEELEAAILTRQQEMEAEKLREEERLALEREREARIKKQQEEFRRLDEQKRIREEKAMEKLRRSRREKEEKEYREREERNRRYEQQRRQEKEAQSAAGNRGAQKFAGNRGAQGYTGANSTQGTAGGAAFGRDAFRGGSAAIRSGFFSGVSNSEELKRRYKDLMKEFHPDNGGGNVEAMEQVRKEYEELSRFFKSFDRHRR